MIYQGLKGQRYLVVMDDVWGNQALEELKSVFSDDKNGSRILFTTRNKEVGMKAQHSSEPHTLRFFEDNESWTLLKEKVFGKDKCPKELLEIGVEIAKACKGLPMSIIAIIGILKTSGNDIEFWKKIEKDLISSTIESPDIQCMHILELSYYHLPNDLKPCFLYFTTFEEDNEVTVQKLIHIWIAEGFVREVNLKSPEVVAESYVMDLIGRSFVMATKKRSGGRIKTCKVHDMVYNLCSRKMEEENFLHYRNGYDNLFPYSQLDHGIDSEYRPIAKTYFQRRLSISSKRKHFGILKPSGPFVRTPFFPTTSTYPRCPYEDVSFINEEFKLLSVLDIESINFGSSFPKGIELLYPLRYLAISGDIRFVPSTIAKLSNLETFIVKGLIGKVALPHTLWSMSKLRHIHVGSQATFRLRGGSDVESSSKLNNMVSLSCPTLFDGDNSVEMMKLFPNVQKLKCTFSDAKRNSKKRIHFPILDFLVDLESLKVMYHGSPDLYCQLKGVTFPLNLKTLSLSNFRFTWDEFLAIGELPNLKILNLKYIDFDSPEWEINDEEFQKLEYLKLDYLKIIEWTMESGSLPILKQLVLRSGHQLEEVPSSFGEISTLQMIEMNWCSASAGESVVQIQEKKLHYKYNEFRAYVNCMA